MKYRILMSAMLIAVFATGTAAADQVWEGTAAMSRYGEFPVSGFYGASNSFPVNTVVSVENPSNSRKAEIIIVDTLADKNLFLLLSKDASEKLGIEQDDILNIKARVVKEVEIPELSETEGTPDPDYSPLAYESDILSGREGTEVFPENPEAEFTDENETGDNGISEGAKTAAEDVIIIYDENAVPDEAEEVAEATNAVEETADDGNTPDTAGNGEAGTVAAAAVVPDEKPEVLSEETAVPDEKGGEVTEYEEKYVLLPSAPKPPEGGIAETSENEVDNGLPVLEIPKTDGPGNLEKETAAYGEPVKGENIYYLQIGAYSEKNVAEKIAGNIQTVYPLIIHFDDNVYKVMAGPLTRDERGAALYYMRSSGFRDAFIRKGE